MAAVRAGDDRAFEQLYHRYERRIGAYIYGMVKDHGRAEDITQDVFMSALRRMRATDRAIVFKPWIYEIAKNACIDAFRRSKRAEEISYDADGATERLHLVSNGPTPDAAVDTRMSLDHLRGAFGGLTETHHQVLVMRELEGLSYRQIGERLGVSRPSVESTLFRARRRLSEEYEELVSGERCRRVQSIVAGATGGRVGARDQRKMARHVSHCQPCRRAAFAAGLDPASLAPRRPAREKIAALLPLPAFLKRRLAGHAAGDDRSLTSVGAHGATMAQLSTAAAHYAEPVMNGWAKAAAVAAAVAVAGVAAHDTGFVGGARDERAAPVGRQAAPARETAPALHARPAAHKTSAGRGAGTSAGGSASQPAPSASGSPSSSAPAGDSPVSSTTKTKLPSAATGNPVTKAARRLTEPGTGSVPVKTPKVPVPQAPKVEVPRLPDPPASVPDPGGAVSGATGAVNGAAGGAVGGATGAVNGAAGAAGDPVNGAAGAVDDAAGAAGDAVAGTVGGVTGGGILSGG